MDEESEQALEALMRHRKTLESRLNRALNELLGSAQGESAALAAIDEMETHLRAIASFIAALRP